MSDLRESLNAAIAERARNRALEAAEDAVQCIREHRTADAKSMLREALLNLEDVERREQS